MSSVEYETVAPFGGPPNNTPPALIAFILGILVVCFVAFSLAYLCKYCFSSVIHTWGFQRTASGSLIRLTPHMSPLRGLDPSLLQVFPTFPYSSVKDLRKQKYSLECAICLFEFEDDSMLRLLTLCCHVFHQDCIDLWLRSHKTCPVCRRDLDSPAEDETQKSGADVVAEEAAVAVDAGAVSPTSGDEVRIDVREGGEGGGGGGGGGGVNDGNKKQEESEGGRPQGEQMFIRSHSTGHSIVMIRGEGDEGKDDEKYTLRLPEHVLRVRQNKHHCTRSCASYKDMMTTLVAPAPCSYCGFVQPLSAGCSFPGQSQKS